MQHDYTTVLACLVKTFPSKKEFRDLVQLTDYNDPESDFFEHMKHIQVRGQINRKWLLTLPLLIFICLQEMFSFSFFQIHRRGRALRKLAKQLTEGHVAMTPRSLQNYIMPYAMTALLDDKMLKVGAQTCKNLNSCTWKYIVCVFVCIYEPLLFQCAAAWEHDISISGGGGRRVPPADLVQIPLLFETLHPHPADITGRAKTGC